MDEHEGSEWSKAWRGFQTWSATFDEERRDTIVGWIGFLICVAIGIYVYSIGPTAVSIKYSVSPGKVFVDPKPTDCDFWHAPVGFKSCYYESLVWSTGSGGKPEYRYDSKTG